MLSSTYGKAALSERTCCKWSGVVVEKRKFLRISNWRYYLLKTRAKRKKNWQNHWHWLNKPLRNASKTWEWFRNKEIVFPENKVSTWCGAWSTHAWGIIRAGELRRSHSWAWHCRAYVSHVVVRTRVFRMRDFKKIYIFILILILLEKMMGK